MLGKPVATKKSPQQAGNPSPAAAHPNSDPVGATSAINYYNIPRLVPRNFRSAGQSECLGSANPPIPRRTKPPPVATSNCAPTDLTKPPKDMTFHSYYVYSVPATTATTEANRLPAGKSTRSGTLPRSESLNNVSFSSPTGKAKPSLSNNSNSNNTRHSGVGGRLWRHCSVGDILHKLQSVVSGGFSLPRGLVRSVSRFSVSHPSAVPANPNPAAGPTKVSPDHSAVSDGTWSGLKRRWASEILHRPSMQQLPEDVVIPPPRRKSPTPEKEAPPRPPPRLIVRQKPPTKMKVLLRFNIVSITVVC